MISLADDGTVVGIASWHELDREAGVEFHAGMLLPGLVDAYCHLEDSPMCGLIASGDGPAAAFRRMAALHRRFGVEEIRRAAGAADARMWHDGVSAVGDVAVGEDAFEAKARSSIRYRTFVEISGLREDSAAESRTLLRHPCTSLTPRSLCSVSDAVFRSVCREGDAPLVIRFMESAAEDAFFRREGPLWEQYASQGRRCDFLHYGSVAERLVACVPRDRRVILVHNRFVTQQIIDRVMDHFTAPVWWCLCPGSNRHASALRPPVELLRANGLNICIGTDSPVWGSSLPLLDGLRLLGDAIPLAERLQWATAGGAAALGFGSELGRLEEGRRPGVVLLRGFDPSSMRLLPDSTTVRLA